MPLQTITSAQALAQGALVAGVKVVTSYPGSPSSETVELLIELAEQHGLHVEWSSNEKVAMEIGIGVSIAGRRALVCTKSVGMNAMIDPLMVLNLTPVHGGSSSCWATTRAAMARRTTRTPARLPRWSKCP